MTTRGKGRSPARVLSCAAVLLASVSTACAGGGTSTQEPPSDIRARAVTFKASDGRTLTGRLFGSGRVGVTLAHMYPADARSWEDAGRRIAEAGYTALAFNFRGYADSEGPRQIAKAPVDVEAARGYLARRGAKDVAFVGASMGGTASLVAGSDGDPLAIVAISAPTRFMGLDAASIATGVQRPVLLLASRGDDAAFQAVAELERALPNPDTRIYDGDAHGTNLLEARPEALDEIISFLKRYAPLTRTASTQSP